MKNVVDNLGHCRYCKLRKKDKSEELNVKSKGEKERKET